VLGHEVPRGDLRMFGCDPREIRDLVAGSDERRRIPVAFEAPTHRQFFFLANDLHAVDATVTGGAADARVQVRAVIEVDEVGQVMHAHPRHGLVLREAVADRGEREALREEADVFVDETIRKAQTGLQPLLNKLSDVPKNLQPAVTELRCAIELLLTGTPLGQRREEFARSLKKEDEVYVPKFRARCKVRKINKGERIVTVLLNGIPTAVGFDDISWIESEPSRS